MKKLGSFLVAFLLLQSFTFRVGAVGSVPEEVMKAMNSVVRILAEYSDGYGTGSGFVIGNSKEHSYIATNFHVVEGDPYNISVWVGENETVSADILASAPEKDLCLLKLDRAVDLEPLPIAHRDAVQGEAVFAVGFPAAADYLSDRDAHTSQDATITDGIVSAVRDTRITEFGAPVKVLQINAALNPGNSGGPLFNKNGTVIAVNTYGIDDAQGIFGAISANELLVLMEQNGIRANNSTVSGIVMGILIFAGAASLSAIVFLCWRRRSKRKLAADVPLKAFMAAHPEGMEAEKAVALLYPALLQISHLHDGGKRHLQISPELCVVTSDGLKVLPPDHSEAGRDTSGFAAPEVYDGADSEAASDIYSLCAVLSYVLTGQVPENALKRLKHGESSQPLSDSSIYKVIARGMELSPEKRYSTLRELISELAEFHTDRYLQDESRKTEKKRKSKNKKKIVLSICGIVIFAAAAAFGGRYFLLLKYARSGNPELTAKTMFAPDMIELFNPELVRFAEGCQLLVDGNYEEARDLFKGLKNYENAYSMVLESDYRYALQMADQKEYDIAEKTLRELAQHPYKDSIEQRDKVSFLWALEMMEEGEYLQAYSKMRFLSEYDYTKAAFSELKEHIYTTGKDLYDQGDFREADKYFDKIHPYRDSDKYMLLIDARLDIYCFVRKTDEMVQDLLQIFYFEDANEALVCNSALAQEFLRGRWESEYGDYYFNMGDDGSISYNIPHIQYGDHYDVNEGVIFNYYSSEPDVTRNQFYISVINPDCIEIYSYKNGRTYSLFRQ